MLLSPELARAAIARTPVTSAATRDIKFTQQLNRVAALAAMRSVAPTVAMRPQ
jgi:hypothetical protein